MQCYTRTIIVMFTASSTTNLADTPTFSTTTTYTQPLISATNVFDSPFTHTQSFTWSHNDITQSLETTTTTKAVLSPDKGFVISSVVETRAVPSPPKSLQLSTNFFSPVAARLADAPPLPPPFAVPLTPVNQLGALYHSVVLKPTLPVIHEASIAYCHLCKNTKERVHYYCSNTAGRPSSHSTKEPCHYIYCKKHFDEIVAYSRYATQHIDPTGDYINRYADSVDDIDHFICPRCELVCTCAMCMQCRQKMVKTEAKKMEAAAKSVSKRCRSTPPATVSVKSEFYLDNVRQSELDELYAEQTKWSNVDVLAYLHDRVCMAGKSNPSDCYSKHGYCNKIGKQCQHIYSYKPPYACIKCGGAYHERNGHLPGVGLHQPVH